MKKHSQEDIVRIIKSAVVLSNQKTVAANIGCSQQFLCDILKGRRQISDRIAEALGFQRREYYVDTKRKSK